MVEGGKLQNRYRLDRKIAAGGMGAVYEATDERLGRTVAVKLLKEELVDDPRFVERFRREARSVAALGHPNIASIFDYGEDEHRHFIVMEYVEGNDLARVIRSDGQIAPDRTVAIGLQIADALAHAHAAGIVHRDIKPGNVIVGEPNDRTKVTDFGIARAGGEATLTATGSVLGTAQYLSPEQASGGEIGPWTDVYATGIVLYEMLTGSVPFTGDSPIAIAMRHVSDDVPAPSALNHDVPADLDHVVRKATAKEPAQRYRDAGELHAALAGVGGAPTTARLTGAAGAGALAAGAMASGGETLVDDGQTVWPIPGDRWDPRKLGRAVLITFIALGVIALLLLGAQLLGGEETGQDPPANEQPPPDTEPDTPEETTVTVPSVIGLDEHDAEGLLKDAGFEVEKQDVSTEEEKGTVVDQAPDGEAEAEPNATVTISVSTGPEEDGEEEEDGHGPTDPGKGKGRGKGKGKGND